MAAVDGGIGAARGPRLGWRWGRVRPRWDVILAESAGAWAGTSSAMIMMLFSCLCLYLCLCPCFCFCLCLCLCFSRRLRDAALHLACSTFGLLAICQSSRPVFSLLPSARALSRS